jgi:hypothetical protein
MKDKTIYNRKRMEKDASYFPFQFKCKVCNCKYGSDTDRDNGFCPFCITDKEQKGRKKSFAKDTECETKQRGYV